MRPAIFMAVMMVAALLGGCASPGGPTSVDVAPGAYAATFDAARRVIRDERFDLERVDASEGVITSRPKHSAGVMTLWDGEQSEAGQELEDFAHNQRRVVRVTFEAPTSGAGEGGVTSGESGVDLRGTEMGLVMHVRVYVLRNYKPGWRVETSSVRLSTHTYDPALGHRGMAPDYETAVDEDRLFAARLAARISEEAGRVEVVQAE